MQPTHVSLVLVTGHVHTGVSERVFESKWNYAGLVRYFVVTVHSIQSLLIPLLRSQYQCSLWITSRALRVTCFQSKVVIWNVFLVLSVFLCLDWRLFSLRPHWYVLSWWQWLTQPWEHDSCYTLLYLPAPSDQKTKCTTCWTELD